jgi:hypothetical protein
MLFGPKPMKAFLILFSAFLIIASHAIAQHPLEGAWEMVSIKGVNAEGEKFSDDTSHIREVKIITPTHYMLIAHDVEADSLVFNRCYAGTIHIQGNKFNELPTLSSVAIYENVKTDFTWRIEGDKFIQSGTVTRPDGKKIVLEELIFRRINTAQSYPNNPSNGTWKLLSSNYTTADGKSHSDTNENVIALQIITPTHWMYVSSRDKKFEHAMGGSYTKQGKKYLPNLDFASFPKKLWGTRTEMTEELQGNRLELKGVSVFDDGKKFTWTDVFERVK